MKAVLYFFKLTGFYLSIFSNGSRPSQPADLLFISVIKNDNRSLFCPISCWTFNPSQSHIWTLCLNSAVKAEIWLFWSPLLVTTDQVVSQTEPAGETSCFCSSGLFFYLLRRVQSLALTAGTRLWYFSVCSLTDHLPFFFFSSFSPLSCGILLLSPTNRKLMFPWFLFFFGAGPLTPHE